jgi:SAM-dependent methyltransferase
LHWNYASGNAGPWTSGDIPSFITSNAALAHRYARVLLAWLRDLHAAGKLDPKQPVPVVEVGCGTGRFTFHLLRALDELEEVLRRHCIRFSYTATDISRKRLKLVEQHKELAAYFESKRLNTAVLDLLTGPPPWLQASSNPTAVICNYVLDSLPCDCFRTQGARLFETRVALEGDYKKDGLNGLSWRFSQHPTKVPYYRDRILDGILERRLRREKPETLLFPCGAIRGIRKLWSLAQGPVLLLVADKAVPSGDAGMPRIERHGKFHFSMPVDFSLLKEFALAEGGEMLVSRHGAEVICFAALLRGVEGAAYAETRLAFEDQFERMSPTAAMYVAARLEEQAPALSIHDYLAYLRLTHWDPHQWMSLFPLFIRQACSIPAEMRSELLESLERLAERWYAPDRRGGDLAFLTGCTYLELGEAAKACVQFERSIEEHGRTPAVVFQLGRAEARAGNARKGAALAREALAADPNLGGFLERLGLMRGGVEQARTIAEELDWEAGLE